jgi:hypothetical protein
VGRALPRDLALPLAPVPLATLAADRHVPCDDFQPARHPARVGRRTAERAEERFLDDVVGSIRSNLPADLVTDFVPQTVDRL